MILDSCSRSGTQHPSKDCAWGRQAGMGKACEVWEDPVRLGKHSDLPCPELSPRTGWELHRPHLGEVGCLGQNTELGARKLGNLGSCLPSSFLLSHSPLPSLFHLPPYMSSPFSPPSSPSFLLPPPLFFPLAPQNPCHPRASPVVPRDHRCSFSRPEVPPHSPASSPSPDSGDQIRF